jgi:hydrogenase maturation protein HypF
VSRVIATGAYLKNRAALWQGGRRTMSALHGDLSTPQACVALEDSVHALLQAADGRIDAVAYDLHPDFHSTRVALALAAELGVPALAVQHHLAHIGVALAEAGRADEAAVPPTEAVIGIALDGVGLGDDGTAWGGEVLRVQAGQAQRVAHLQPLGLPGGDRAAQQPWRMAAAALHAMGRSHEISPRFAPRVGQAAAEGVAGLLQRRLNCPVTTSAGRWFDAAAAALGLCDVQHDEAQAAMALEALAATVPAQDITAALPMPHGVIDLRPLLAELFELADAGQAAVGARRFHDSLADSLALAAIAAAQDAAARTVVLGGGCFFNRLLTQRLCARLAAAGLCVLQPQAVSVGDAGLALGQAWVAAQRLLSTHPHKEMACA